MYSINDTSINSQSTELVFANLKMNVLRRKRFVKYPDRISETLGQILFVQLLIHLINENLERIIRGECN